jgi:hypothetical protein
VGETESASFTVASSLAMAWNPTVTGRFMPGLRSLRPTAARFARLGAAGILHQIRKMLLSMIADHSSSIGQSLDKRNSILRAVAVPVPDQRPLLSPLDVRAWS